MALIRFHRSSAREQASSTPSTASSMSPVDNAKVAIIRSCSRLYQASKVSTKTNSPVESAQRFVHKRCPSVLQVTEETFCWVAITKASRRLCVYNVLRLDSKCGPWGSNPRPRDYEVEAAGGSDPATSEWSGVFRDLVPRVCLVHGINRGILYRSRAERAFVSDS